MAESTLIRADKDVSVFVDESDENRVWLSIQTMQGSAYCTMSPRSAREMIAALKAVLGDTE